MSKVDKIKKRIEYLMSIGGTLLVHKPILSGGLKTEVCSIDTIYVIHETLTSKKGEIISKEFYVEYRDTKVLEDKRGVSSDVEELFVWCLEKADINTDKAISDFDNMLE